MKKIHLLFLAIAFAFAGTANAVGVGAGVYDIVVAKEGGDYPTIQQAINAATGTARTTIYIKKGVYKEKVLVNKANVSLIGQSAESVIITYDDYSGKGSLGTSTCETMKIDNSATGFYGENFTVENSYGQGAQAVALNVRPDQAAFKNVRMISFQDTFYSWVGTQTNRQYYYQCYIEGATDFICGGGIAYFDECDIYCVSAANGGYVTAAQPSADRPYGYVFQNCVIDGDNLLNASKPYYLGRPWANNTDGDGKTAFLNTKIKESILSPEGWYPWSGGQTSNYYFEYNSMTLDGLSALNTASRISWSKQLTAPEAATYSLSNVLGSWDPTALVVAPATPTSLQAAAKDLSWDAVAGAKGYVIVRNNKAIGFSTTNSFNDATAADATGYTYTVQAVSTNGNLSAKSNEALVNGGSADSVPPSVPTDVKAKETANYGVEITWTASTDNEGVAGYKIYKNGGELATVLTGLSYQETIPSKERDKNIVYQVSAFDDADNESAYSTSSTSSTAKVKTALIDENFANWDEYTTPATPTSVKIYGAGEERTVELVASRVMPTRGTSGGSPFGSLGAIRMENGGTITLPSVPSIESFFYTAGTASSDYTVNIVLEKFDGSSWIEVETKEIVQLSNKLEYTDLRQKTPIQLRLRNLNASVVYVHDIYLNAYVPGNDPYPTDYETGDILIDEHFNGQAWVDNATTSALTQSVFVPITILDVARTLEVTTASQIQPTKGQTAAPATAGAIYLEKKGRNSYLVLPELPSCQTITAVWCLGNDKSRSLTLEKFENNIWVPVISQAPDTSTKLGTLSYTFDTPDPIKLRLSNEATDGAIYLHDLKVTAFKSSGGDGIKDVKTNPLQIVSNVVTNQITFSNAADVNSAELFAINGQVLKRAAKGASSINVSDLQRGYYLLKMTTTQGDIMVGKILKK